MWMDQQKRQQQYSSYCWLNFDKTTMMLLLTQFWQNNNDNNNINNNKINKKSDNNNNYINHNKITTTTTTTTFMGCDTIELNLVLIQICLWPSSIYNSEQIIIPHIGHFFPHIILSACRFAGNSIKSSTIFKYSSASMITTLAQYSISVLSS